VGPELGDVQVTTGAVLGHAASKVVHGGQKEWRGLGSLAEDGDEARLGQFRIAVELWLGTYVCWKYCVLWWAWIQVRCSPVTQRD
jgi:hypothetical protein